MWEVGDSDYSEHLTSKTGLDIGVAQLSKYERAIMTIPAHLAYGEKGFPGLIPGKSELIFDIELLEIS